MNGDNVERISVKQTGLKLDRPTAAWSDWWTGLDGTGRWGPAGLALGFCLAHVGFGGFRPDHLLLAGVFLLLYYAGPVAREWLRFLLPVLLMIALYDSQRYYAGFLHGHSHIHIEAPYRFDEFFFGIRTADGVLLPSQWCQRHTLPLLDVIAGLSYIAFVPVFLLTGAYFRFHLGRTGSDRFSEADVRRHTNRLMWSLFWVSAVSCLTYYLYPAAPPWYVDFYGMGPVRLDAPASAAGAVRFDALLGVNFLESYYARTPNVFGAVPSLHAAYPLLTVYFAFKFRALRVFSLVYYLLICFAAVYLNHHYILDLLWGSAYALLTAWLMDRVWPRHGRGNRERRPTI